MSSAVLRTMLQKVRNQWRRLFTGLFRPKVAALPITEPSPFGLGPAKRVIKCWGFDLFIDAADELVGVVIAERRAYESHVCRAIARLLPVGGTFLDLGANVGYISMVAARHVGPTGKVITLDINPGNCALLWYSAQRNGFKHVQVCWRAAAEREQVLDFWTPKGTGNSALVFERLRPHLGKGPYSLAQKVEAGPVDDLVAPDQPIHLIKMDIEGSELPAVRGMKKLLSRVNKPALIFEFFPGMLRQVGNIEPAQLLDELRSFGYSLHSVERNGGTSPASLSNDQALQLARPNLVDLIALPANQNAVGCAA